MSLGCENEGREFKLLKEGTNLFACFLTSIQLLNAYDRMTRTILERVSIEHVRKV